jgi:hypothetical protein
MRKLVMTASAVAMAIAGLAGSFLPHELLRAGSIPAEGVLPVAVQLYAALLLGFAIVNWMAKDSLIGGIYNRPLAVGNLLHFASGALALLKYGPGKTIEVIVTVVYVALALGFAMIVFRSPVGR